MVDFAAPDNVEPPLREGLFSTTQLESHARFLATDRKLAHHPGPEMLLRRLAENEGIVRRSYEEVAEALVENLRWTGPSVSFRRSSWI